MSRSLLLKIEEHIVVDVYLLTTTLFLWLWSLSMILLRFQAEVVYISPWMFRNSSH